MENSIDRLFMKENFKSLQPMPLSAWMSSAREVEPLSEKNSFEFKIIARRLLCMGHINKRREVTCYRHAPEELMEKAQNCDFIGFSSESYSSFGMDFRSDSGRFSIIMNPEEKAEYAFLFDRSDSKNMRGVYLSSEAYNNDSRIEHIFLVTPGMRFFEMAGL